MKSTVLIPGVLLLLSIAGIRTEAQVNDFGIRFGLQASGFITEGELSEYPLPFIYAGIYKDRAIFMSGFLSFNPGLEYFIAGSWQDADNYRAIQYLGIPLAVRMHFGPWYLQTGFNANVRLADRRIEGGQKVNDPGSRAAFIDLPWQIGAGVRIAKIFVEARYNYGWTEVIQGSRLAYLQAGAGVVF